MASLLSVRDLSVTFPAGIRSVPVVRNVSFRIEAGEFVGLVGESGAGKSVTALAILRLLPARGRISGGAVELAGRNLLRVSESEMLKVRGGRIAIIFQEPIAALNPLLSIGFQIAEAVRAHRRVGRQQAWREAERLADLVALPAAGQRLKDYPHQLSGGQRQRAMIAMALAASPDLLIADEPTSALDVTVQAQILELLESLRAELGLAVLLITHDLAVVAEVCRRVVVMYAGQVVEQAGVLELFDSPAHPYTRGLLTAVSRQGEPPVAGSLPTIPGQIPDPGHLPSGCSFHPRCAEVLETCHLSEPELVQLCEGRSARCFLHAGLAASREARG